MKFDELAVKLVKIENAAVARDRADVAYIRNRREEDLERFVDACDSLNRLKTELALALGITER